MGLGGQVKHSGTGLAERDYMADCPSGRRFRTGGNWAGLELGSFDTRSEKGRGASDPIISSFESLPRSSAMALEGEWRAGRRMGGTVFKLFTTWRKV